MQNNSSSDCINLAKLFFFTLFKPKVLSKFVTMHIYTYVYAYYYYFSDIIPISLHFTISFGLLKTTWTWLNNAFIAWLVFCLHFISNHFIFSCFFLLIWCVFFFSCFFELHACIKRLWSKLINRISNKPVCNKIKHILAWAMLCLCVRMYACMFFQTTHISHTNWY